jgi:hypothetical protein
MLQTYGEAREAGLTGTASPRFGHDVSQMPLHPPTAGAIQTKLPLNKPKDEYEQAADRLSEQVRRMPEPQLQRACLCGGGCPQGAMEQSDREHERLQTKRTGIGDLGQTAVPLIAHKVLSSPGQPIALATRALMESRFGLDFRHVRVHTGESAEMSARTINAHAYTVGNHIVFGPRRFDSPAMEGLRLLAHELTPVVQQSAGHAPSTVARQPADAEKDKPKAPPKAPQCETGRALHWGQETTCSRWGFFLPEKAEQGEGKTMKSIACCNSWPWSVDDYARRILRLNGAASCKASHMKEIATVSLNGDKVQVLCSDNFVSGATQLIELSPQAMQDLSGSLENLPQVEVCYSGSKQEGLCEWNGRLPRNPEAKDCLTQGCPVLEGTPKLKDTGWPKV